MNSGCLNLWKILDELQQSHKLSGNKIKIQGLSGRKARQTCTPHFLYQNIQLQNSIALASNLIAMGPDLIVVASNLIAMASNLIAIASNLIAMASNLVAMAPAT